MATIALNQLEALLRNSLRDALHTLAKQQVPSGRLMSLNRADVDLVSAMKTDEHGQLLVDLLGLESVVQEDKGFLRRDVQKSLALTLVQPLPPVLLLNFDVTIPEVVFKPLAEALAALQQIRLRVGIVVEQVEHAVPPGLVIGQSPAPGSVVQAGKPVHLVISKAASPGEDSMTIGSTLTPVEIPALIGLSLRTGLDIILALGLRIGRVTEEGSTVPRGIIMRQHLPASIAVSPGTAVDLVVARVMS